MHTVEQTVLIDKKAFLFISDAIGENAELYDTKVSVDGEYLGDIKGTDILEFIVECATPNLHSLYFSYKNPKEVIQRFLID